MAENKWKKFNDKSAEGKKNMYQRPMTEQELFRKQFDMDDDEVRHYRTIDKKYKDRLKEKEFSLDGLGGEDEQDEEELIREAKSLEYAKVQDERTKGERLIKLNGLDFELLDRERKAAAEGNSEQQKQETAANNEGEVLSEKDEMLRLLSLKYVKDTAQKIKDQGIEVKAEPTKKLTDQVNLTPKSEASKPVANQSLETAFEKSKGVAISSTLEALLFNKKDEKEVEAPPPEVLVATKTNKIAEADEDEEKKKLNSLLKKFEKNSIFDDVPKEAEVPQKEDKLNLLTEEERATLDLQHSTAKNMFEGEEEANLILEEVENRKRKSLAAFEEGQDFYMECFQGDTLSRNELKSLKKFAKYKQSTSRELPSEDKTNYAEQFKKIDQIRERLNKDKP